MFQQEVPVRHEKFPEISDSDCTRENKVRAEVTLLCEVRQGIRPWARVRLMDISQTVFPHPTLSEMLHEATLAAYGRALHI